MTLPPFPGSSPGRASLPPSWPLRAGNTTILVGVEESLVPAAIEVIKEHSRSRQAIVPTSPDLAFSGMMAAIPTEVTVGGATIFVVDVDHFERA